jgi:hypothetical protein
MEASARDSTQDWVLPEQSKPPRIGELEARIDEAVATARASEAAVMTVGAAALDAAEQARRAANLAERASAAVFGGAPPRQAGADVAPPRQAGADVAPPPTPSLALVDDDDSLRDFSARADRLAARLKRLESSPFPAAG